MRDFWINVFRRWDGTIVFSQTANGAHDRRAAETALLYQGRCRLIYRFGVASGRGSARDCTRATEAGFVDLNGPCRGCGAGSFGACLRAFRGAVRNPIHRRDGGASASRASED
ncbi:MAG TPA: hypothetical protein VF641_01485 [Methylobacterium sp.]|jgi:hypothetical protein